MLIRIRYSKVYVVRIRYSKVYVDKDTLFKGVCYKDTLFKGVCCKDTLFKGVCYKRCTPYYCLIAVMCCCLFSPCFAFLTRILVTRENILQEAYSIIMKEQSRNLPKMKLEIVFKGEEG